MKKYPLTIFFPCYNEELNIEKLTRRILAVAPEVSDDYEIIIINDGSKDRTGVIADQLARENPAIRVIHHKTNKGYGAALQAGFRHATRELVFYTDGDGQFDPSEIKKLLPLIERYDIVSGYRIKRQDSRLRKINAFLWGIMVTTLFGIKVVDIDAAFKLYRRSVFEQIDLESQGAMIDTEIFVKAAAKGCTIGQVGVNHYPRTAGVQTGAKITVILRAFRELLGLKINCLKQEKICRKIFYSL